MQYDQRSGNQIAVIQYVLQIYESLAYRRDTIVIERYGILCLPIFGTSTDKKKPRGQSTQ